MKRQMSNVGLIFFFSVVLGAVIAGIVWLYLKIANVGVTVIWEIVPAYVDARYYTILMCLAGGVVISLFRRKYGVYPERMADAIKRVKTTREYPYDKIPLIMTGAFLSLFFGGSVGPESGLVCLLLGLCFWAMRQLGMARWKMELYIKNNAAIARTYVFRMMLSGLFLPAEQMVYDHTIAWKRKEQVFAGVSAGICGLLTYELLNAMFGRALFIPHLGQGELYARDKVGAILLIAVGIGAGYLYLISRRLLETFFRKIEARNLGMLNAVLGGLILGLVGSMLPMTMFSGGNQIQAMQYEYMQYTPYLLILTGVVKLILTNVCIQSGWRGGHFFPVIFSGLSIGYGFSVLLGTNQIYSVVLVTGALLGTILQQPLGAIALSVIFFPAREFGWICLASAIGGCLPVPAALRIDPERRGFVYRMIHFKPQKGLPMKK